MQRLFFQRCFPDKPFETFGGQPAVDATIFQESAATTDHVSKIPKFQVYIEIDIIGSFI